MKRVAFFFLLIIAATPSQAQDYLISYSATGASTAVDSVRVENLTQGTSLTVGSGNQLHLSGTISSVDPGPANTGNSLVVSWED